MTDPTPQSPSHPLLTSLQTYRQRFQTLQKEKQELENDTNALPASDAARTRAETAIRSTIIPNMKRIQSLLDSNFAFFYRTKIDKLNNTVRQATEEKQERVTKRTDELKQEEDARAKAEAERVQAEAERLRRELKEIAERLDDLDSNIETARQQSSTAQAQRTHSAIPSHVRAHSVASTLPPREVTPAPEIIPLTPPPWHCKTRQRMAAESQTDQGVSKDSPKSRSATSEPEFVEGSSGGVWDDSSLYSLYAYSDGHRDDEARDSGNSAIDTRDDSSAIGASSVGHATHSSDLENSTSFSSHWK